MKVFSAACWKNSSNNLFENLSLALVFSAIILMQSLKILAIFLGFMTYLVIKGEYLMNQIVPRLSDI